MLPNTVTAPRAAMAQATYKTDVATATATARRFVRAEPPDRRGELLEHRGQRGLAVERSRAQCRDEVAVQRGAVDLVPPGRPLERLGALIEQGDRVDERQRPGHQPISIASSDGNQ